MPLGTQDPLEVEALKYASTLPSFDSFESDYRDYLDKEILPMGHVAISAANVFKRPLPTTDSYVPGFIYAGAINLIAGEPKAGKSTLLWYLLNALTLGKQFLGVSTVKGNVLLVTEQNELSFRKKAVEVPGFEANENIHIVFPEHSPLMTKWEERIAFWDKELSATGDSHVLVIDTFLPFASLPPNGENDSACISERLTQLKPLYKTRPNLAIVLVHHVRKPAVIPYARKRSDRDDAPKYANLRDARGSSAIAGGVDNCVMLSKPDFKTTQRYIHLEGRFDDEKEFTIALTDTGYVSVNDFAGSFGER